MSQLGNFLYARAGRINTSAGNAVRVIPSMCGTLSDFKKSFKRQTSDNLSHLKTICPQSSEFSQSQTRTLTGNHAGSRFARVELDLPAKLPMQKNLTLILQVIREALPKHRKPGTNI